MKITNKHKLPTPIVNALSKDTYTRGNSHRSVTQLIDSPRIRILTEKHWEDLEEDISSKLCLSLEQRFTLCLKMPIRATQSVRSDCLLM